MKQDTNFGLKSDLKEYHVCVLHRGLGAAFVKSESAEELIQLE